MAAGGLGMGPSTVPDTIVREDWPMRTRRIWQVLAALMCAVLCALAVAPWAQAEADGPQPIYQTLDELAGKRFAYVNGSVYNLRIQERLDDTSEDFYPSLAECVAAVEAGKADGAVQLSYCCQLAVNRRPGTVALLPEPVADVSEGFFFPKGSPLRAQFNELIAQFSADGTLKALEEKWVDADEAGKTLPKQDWDAPNGTLRFATSGVLEPFSYVGSSDDSKGKGQPKGYDVELALLIARELGYHLEISTIPMDAIFAAVDSGKVDFGGTLTQTPERASVCDFSDAVMPTTISVIVKAEGAAASTDGSTGDAGFVAGIKDSFHKTFIEEDRWKLILSGLGVTILVSVSAGVLGVLLGFVVVICRNSGAKWLGKLVDGYQALMGGVPLVVVLMVLYYVVFGSIDIAGEVVAILAFALSFGSAAGSTMWTAVKGIDIIQEETGLALGYSPAQTFSKIVLPQARQQYLPQLMGQFVSLVKDTAIVGYIAVQDLTRAGDLIRSRTMDAFFPLIATALIYFLFCRLLAWALGKLTKIIDGSDKQRKIKEIQR